MRRPFSSFTKNVSSGIPRSLALADIAGTTGRMFVAEFFSQLIGGHIAMLQYVLDDRLWSLIRNSFKLVLEFLGEFLFHRAIASKNEYCSSTAG